MLVSYSHNEFFHQGSLSCKFDDLIVDCFQKKGMLCLSIKNNIVNIEVKDQEPIPNAITVFTLKDSLAVEVFNQPLSKSAQLLLPLLVDIESIYFPHHQIYSLRRQKQSLGDFCARNLLYACSRNNDVIFNTSCSSSSDYPNLSREVSKRYLWVLQSMINDPTLKRKEIMNKLIINLYFKVLSFENNLLETGFREIRNYYLNSTDSDTQIAQPDQFKRFIQLREKMMACFI